LLSLKGIRFRLVMVSLLNLSAPQGQPEVRLTHRDSRRGGASQFIDWTSCANFVRGGDEGMTLLEVLTLLALITSVAAFAYEVGRHTGGRK
jgi:hypothetical protein